VPGSSSVKDASQNPNLTNLGGMSAFNCSNLFNDSKFKVLRDESKFLNEHFKGYRSLSWRGLLDVKLPAGLRI
jgi:hypothetical protein